MSTKQMVSSLLACGTLLVSTQAMAVCYDPANPMASPSLGVRALITDHSGDFVPSPKMNGSGLSVAVFSLRTAFDDPNLTQPHFGNEQGTIYYFDQGPDGKDRVCRSEEWDLPPYDLESERQNKARYIAQQMVLYGQRPQVAAYLKRGYLVRKINNYRYDSKGSVVEVVHIDTPENSIFKETSFSSSCFAYDDLGRVTLYVDRYPHPSCKDAEKNGDSYRRYRQLQHALRLNDAAFARVPASLVDGEARQVRQVWRDLFGLAPGPDAFFGQGLFNE